MKAERLAHFKQILLTELRQRAQHVGDGQAAALETGGEDAKESADLSQRDGTQEMSLQLGERESQMVADIDQALLRIEEGSYGICRRCGHPIDERRLEAMPTARYDADCQGAIEDGKGKSAGPSL
jgi:DnaK suppressor protein